jgi:hypothetical protein
MGALAPDERPPPDEGRAGVRYRTWMASAMT